MAAPDLTPAPETAKPAPAGRIALMVSDVDGTLVDPDKALAPATVAAVRRLREAGIGFAAVSSRPPRGMAMLIEPLGLALPLGAFNGGTIFRPDMTVLSALAVPEAAARTTVETLRRFGADIWVFADNQWLTSNPDGPYVGRERHTVQFDPTIVPDVEPYLARAGKIVGSSADFDRLARCEAELQGLLAGTATARRSQRYYLDITHPEADKGHAVAQIAAAAGVALAEVAVIGDMANDVPMFRRAGLSIAMGNAIDEVKALAHFAATSNAEDGFARAVEEYVLPRAARGR
ncbi:Cof-type HAD-IIB family hydrolase [Inquilinus limosus]|uniref:Cof-type HAD-IIB family hydrolase n=1 Tax=Inquilinus limosus TaxID=171674 RepID=UPI00041A4B3E|nr:Cof-type HAD-IIB family hydrolase [Inquilinus limosus]